MEYLSEVETFDMDWGYFSLVEFLGSYDLSKEKKNKRCLDIGSGSGVHTKILRKAGFSVFQVDKYSNDAEYQADFHGYQFDCKFDIVFCSHVIEHQRNVGFFLDKIYDLLSDDGVLIITAPKHPAEFLITGHLNCFFTTYFVQHLIHAGFDLKNGKYLSCKHIENTAIVSKAKNFDISERYESGYSWTDKHRERSFIALGNCEIKNNLTFMHNCKIISVDTNNKIKYNFPPNYISKGIRLSSKRFGLICDL